MSAVRNVLEAVILPMWLVIRYGAVPAGYGQGFPASGPPRPLVPPEPIRLDAKAVGFDATNTGQAASADAVAFYSFARKNSVR